jgi:Flp pilus assembly secretin CpaC
MESQSSSAQSKKSLLAIGVLMLSLAALQSPLWRSSAAGIPVAVHTGRATLIASDRSIAQITLDPAAPATAEIVGDHEVLIRGKALGETHLTIASQDGRSSTYRVVVQSDSARSLW